MTSARNASIVEACDAGADVGELAAKYGISRERIRQIFTGMTGFTLRLPGYWCALCQERYQGMTLSEHNWSDSHLAERKRRLQARRAAAHLRHEQEFWGKVDKTGTCWVWTASLWKTLGYGYSGCRDIPYAHRFAYIMENGPIPAGLELDHLCRNRLCVRPSHLEAVTHRENILRSPIALAAINARKTHCPQGHAYQPGMRKCGQLHTPSA